LSSLLQCFATLQVLTTSNITEAIDLAFVDRADIKAYIGNPNLQARWEAAAGSLHGRQHGAAVAVQPRPFWAEWLR
jgi:SpoVK/Ycf46/Vps4 family AAA+-type ATPase